MFTQGQSKLVALSSAWHYIIRKGMASRYCYQFCACIQSWYLSVYYHFKLFVVLEIITHILYLCVCPLFPPLHNILPQMPFTREYIFSVIKLCRLVIKYTVSLVVYGWQSDVNSPDITSDCFSDLSINYKAITYK